MKKHILVAMVFCMCTTLLKAQDSSTPREPLWYKLTLGAGIGFGHPFQQNKYGISGAVEFALQHRRDLYALGTRALSEFQLFGGSYPRNTINSVDITYGKLLTEGTFASSVSAGVGFVTTLTKGKYLSSDPGWLGSSYYEKVRSHTLALPLSARIFWQPYLSGGIGFEFYANLNSKNIFYGLNLAMQVAIKKNGGKRKK
jgi:hypothetical protein